MLATIDHATCAHIIIGLDLNVDFVQIFSALISWQCRCPHALVFSYDWLRLCPFDLLESLHVCLERSGTATLAILLLLFYV